MRIVPADQPIVSIQKRSPPTYDGKRSFRLHYVQGFFRQGDPSQSSVSYPEHIGLLPGRTWEQVDAYMQLRQRMGRKIKLILFLRHGEGMHNVEIAKYGPETWDIQYRHLARYIDPSLTQLGQEQARNASTMLHTEMKLGNLHLDQVVVSPFERTLKTYELAYAHHHDIPVVCEELAREILGVATCDQRRPIADKMQEYPNIDFSGCPTDKDTWWTPDHRETEGELNERARQLLHRLFYAYDADHIGLVSHSILGAACLRVLGHRKYVMATAEFVPLLIEEA